MGIHNISDIISYYNYKNYNQVMNTHLSTSASFGYQMGFGWSPFPAMPEIYNNMEKAVTWLETGNYKIYGI